MHLASNSVDPDPISHSVVSGLCVQCLLMFHFGTEGKKELKITSMARTKCWECLVSYGEQLIVLEILFVMNFGA